MKAQRSSCEASEQLQRKDIRELAHKELDAMDAKRPAAGRIEPSAPAEVAAQSAAEDRDPRSRWISPWETRRPAAGLFPAPTGRTRC